eukprot:c21503_g2_i1.p1 GENE.c21503_g2_i1~~c21503_g2_i1.p1  ORF type:complete len:156 (-),score=60.21 c21503_g2_i1:145-585(-)
MEERRIYDEFEFEIQEEERHFRSSQNQKDKRINQLEQTIENNQKIIQSLQQEINQKNSKISALHDQNHQSKSVLAPEDLICPLSNKLMIDPVIAQDGNTYERNVIEEWFRNGNTESPITGEQMEKFLIANNSIRKLCEKWRQMNEN